jgi:hypothetical protein
MQLMHVEAHVGAILIDSIAQIGLPIAGSVVGNAGPFCIHS